ncbi:MAG: lipid A biosynthesis acyltransferase [Marinilabiliales bacterium]|nr:MAG: lipid A biosynthesis acyltransferase [Marinilabiliales bacterium]
MSSWQGKTRGGKFGYWFFIQILKWPGIKFAYFFLNFVSLYFFLFVSKARNPLLWYFRNIHQYSGLRPYLATLSNFYVFGQTIIDKVVLMSGLGNKFTFNFDGEDYIRQMAKDQGGILVGAHIGNWEIAGHLLKRIDTKVHIVMLEAEHEKIKSMLDDVMTEKKMSIIPITNDFSHLFKIKEALENNEIVAMHGDRFLPGTNAFKRNFFNKNAEFPLGPFLLASKYNKPICFVNALKETSTHYHFFAEEPIQTGKSKNIKDRNAQAEKLLDKYIQQLEKTIKKYPKQWFNYYYFWEV